MMRFLRSLALLALVLPGVAGAQTVPAANTGTARGAITRAAANPARDSAIAQLESFLSRYPDSPLRANALFQLGELLVNRADEEFAASQRAAGTDTTASDAPVRPNYARAITAYEELVRRFPDFQQIDAAAYTLGTLYTIMQRYADAARMFEIVAGREQSRFQSEALFRLGDAYFEQAAQQRGTPRRQLFARAASAYERAVQGAQKNSDIYFLSLYKLGWSYYNQASATSQEEYRKAVETFGELIAAYDQLTPEQQARLGLRGEAIEYMAVAFTQVGGADAANAYFERRGGAPYRMMVLRRVAVSLREQGDFPRAIEAYRAILAQSPNDTSALAIQRDIIDIYQNRLIAPDSAQRARLELVERFAPGSEWARANPGQVDSAQAAREQALRQSGQYLLAQAQQGRREGFAQAAALYERYLSEFASADSARVVNTYLAEAHFGQRNYTAAGSQYARAAYGYAARDSLARLAGQNAIVAFDSALVRSKTDRAAQDSLFSAVDRFVQAFPDEPVAKQALIQKGRRASESERWDVMAQTFRTYAERWPNDRYTPTAQKLVADALYRGGQYAEAQQQWEQAATVAQTAGNRALADSISRLRTAAAATFADTLIRQGEYRRAAEEVYVAIADKDPSSPRAPAALRDAIETYMLADSAARARGDDAASRQARERAIALSTRLVSTYPNYQYRTQYQALGARLLAETGQREEAVTALRALVADNRTYAGRADDMVRIAVTLDSLGREAEAAQAYIEFSTAYPRDERAAGALYNAAIAYTEAGDTTAAARTFGQFATRFPRDERVGNARARQLELLRSSGDTAAAATQLAALCRGRPSDETVRAACAERTAEAAFRRGAAMFADYQALKLVIPNRAQLTQAGVRRASARKQQMLREMTAHFTRAIETGNPQYLAASTFYIGLGQWEYGNFLRDVQLPEGLSEEEQTAAREGSARQAEEFYEAARNSWRQLVEKAEAEEALRDDPGARRWLEMARDALRGDVPATPPSLGMLRDARTERSFS
jgi:TolA-binding protein